MKKLLSILSLAILLVSCGPSRHAIPVEMRHPSKSGIELAGKIVSVVYAKENADAGEQGEGDAGNDGLAQLGLIHADGNTCLPGADHEKDTQDQHKEDDTAADQKQRRCAELLYRHNCPPLYMLQYSILLSGNAFKNVRQQECTTI